MDKIEHLQKQVKRLQYSLAGLVVLLMVVVAAGAGLKKSGISTELLQLVGSTEKKELVTLNAEELQKLKQLLQHLDGGNSNLQIKSNVELTSRKIVIKEGGGKNRSVTIGAGDVRLENGGILQVNGKVIAGLTLPIIGGAIK